MLPTLPVESTGYYFKLRNMIRKGMRGAFTDEKVIMIIAPDENTKLSPDAHEAKIAVCFTVRPIKNGSAHFDVEQLKHLQEHLLLAIENSGLVQHPDAEKYAGAEATTRKGVTAIILYASDSETLERILEDGLGRMQHQKIKTAFENYHR